QEAPSAPSPAPAADAEESGSAQDPDAPPTSGVVPVIISARSEAALAEQAARLREHLSARSDLDLVDVAHSLVTTRTHFDHRAVVICPGPDDSGRQAVLDGLDGLARGETPEHVHMVRGEARAEGKVVFVFPGQGSQWAQMAAGLLDASPVFRASIEACDRALSAYVDWSLLAVLRDEPPASGPPWMKRIDVIQPALFAMMVSLAAMWRSMGIEPDAVIGHSQGEIAAAYVAGALSLDDAARIVALRSLLLTRLAGKGAMASVELPADELAPHMTAYGDRLSIAAENGPRSIVVSGDPEAIDGLVGQLQEAQVFARKVRVDIASHSVHVESIRDELLAQLAGIKPGQAAIPLYSTVRTQVVQGQELGPEYWYQNLRQPVRFAATVDALLGDGHRIFVES
ncbi:MAG: acyltransferase domain-containing protein, partial [Myxococcota bacterium]